MILSHKDIEKLIKERNLIEDYVDLKAQLQPAGFDFTLSKVFEIENFGKLDFTNEERSIPEKKELKFSEEVITISHSDELERMIKEGKIQANNLPTSIHLLRQSIINENFNEIAEAFYFLYNKSITARYEKYRLEDHIVKFSIYYLNDIIKWAKKNFKSKFPITQINLKGK